MYDENWKDKVMKGDSTPLAAHEEKALFARFAEGDRSASDEIILRTRRFVMSLIPEHLNCPIEGQDLFNEGMIAVCEAIQSFDPKLGLRFVTYAKSFIVHRICKYVADNTHSISIPVYVRKQLAEITNFVYQYVAENGKKPSVEEIGKAMGKDAKVIERHLNEYNVSVVSLFKPTYVEDGHTLIDEIPSSSYEDDRNSRDDMELYEAIDALEPEEKEIVRLLYGFSDQGVVSQEEISRRLGIPLCRVRSEHAAAKYKLGKWLGPR